MLGKKHSELTNLKRVNCQVIGQHCLQAYSLIPAMFWIISYADTMQNRMAGVLVEHTPHPPGLRMQSSLTN